MEEITVVGRQFNAHKIDLYGASLLIIQGSKGFLACGYVNLQTAEKLGHAAAIVTGVKDFPDMLSARVVALTPAAKALGVRLEMGGAEALALMA